MPRPRDEPDYRLLSKVSKLYYEQRLTQQDISDLLHLSRQKVSRLLTQARDEGVVQITIRPPPGIYADLEARLEAAFGLREAVVAEVPHDAPEVVGREVGSAAAGYLQRVLDDGTRLGLSWGSTLKALVDSLTPHEHGAIHVVQLLGGVGPPESEEHAFELARRAAHLLDARLSLLPAPGLVESAAVRRALLADAYVQDVLELFTTLDVAFVGIGALETNAVLAREPSRIRPEERQELARAGAVGDIAMRFFDAAGRPVHGALDDRTIGITLDQLRRTGRVVGVAGGPQKTAAIRGALLGRLVDVLVTDRHTAEALVASG